MVEIKQVFNKAIEHVVTICGSTLSSVESSQANLISGLEELERRLESINKLHERLNNNKISEAYQSIEVYKAKIERIKNRISNLKRRITNIENKVASMPN